MSNYLFKRSHIVKNAILSLNRLIKSIAYSSIIFLSCSPMASQDFINKQSKSLTNCRQSAIMIFDFFGVLFSVDKAKANHEVPRPASPNFDAETTMCAKLWYNMDLGIVTKEDVTKELENRGQSLQAVLDYIENIGNYVKPIPQGMRIFHDLYQQGHGMFTLSNLSKWCLAGISNDHYFEQVNSENLELIPNIFDMVHTLEQERLGYSCPEGYSCSSLKGLGKPNKLCYLYFIALNCPDITWQEKIELATLRKRYRRAQKNYFKYHEKVEDQKREGLPVDSDQFRREQNELMAANRAFDELTAILTTTYAESIADLAQYCYFIDDSPSNLRGAKSAGITPISCQCHAVTYFTLLHLNLIKIDPILEQMLCSTPQATAEFRCFSTWTLEELQNFDMVGDALKELRQQFGPQN
ncbi:MAG: hypothetical protein US22_C0001G0008 [candidate division TM6 bacterium GW2011_GWF2_36_6]|nr:MAG: hypothetical protein US22_C0001G0008 [candidate division TM6 bacterium GW2011_GWF2_36_6]